MAKKPQLPKSKAKPAAAAKPKPPSKKKPPKGGTNSSPGKPAAAVNYASPEMLAKYDANTQHQLYELRSVARTNESAYLNAKKHAAELKKAWEVSQTQLNDRIDDRQMYRGQRPPGVQATLLDLPPVKEPKPPAAPLTALPTGDGGYVVVKGATPKDDTNAPPAEKGWYPEDLYKRFPIDRWKGLTAKDLEALRSGKAKRGDSFKPINTVGDLQAFVQPNPNSPDYTRNYGDIQGCGAAAATRISDAEIEFWKEWGGQGAAAFAMEQGYKPDHEQAKKGIPDADSKQPTAGTGTANTGAGDGAPADGQPDAVPAKPGKKPKPGAKLRGGTNGKPVKFPKPKGKRKPADPAAGTPEGHAEELADADKKPEDGEVQE